MTDREFILWLHGFFEVSNPKSIDERQTELIKSKLGLLFNKITPVRDKAADEYTNIPQVYKLPDSYFGPREVGKLTPTCESNSSNHTAKNIYFSDLARKREDGVTNINFYPAEIGASEDEIYSELNRMNSAASVPDLELFPDGKLVFGSIKSDNCTVKRSSGGRGRATIPAPPPPTNI